MHFQLTISEKQPIPYIQASFDKFKNLLSVPAFITTNGDNVTIQVESDDPMIAKLFDNIFNTVKQTTLDDIRQPTLIATGWNDINGGLKKLTPADTAGKIGVFFYSSFNGEKAYHALRERIDTLQFKAVYLAKMEDVTEETLDENGEDQAPTLESLTRVVHFLDNFPNTDAVVSCNVGISRTGALMEYLVQRKGYVLDTAHSNPVFIPNEYMLSLLAEIDPDFSGQPLISQPLQPTLTDKILF